LEPVLRVLSERKICIVEDAQLRNNCGIFRSLPLLLEIIKPQRPVLVSIYDKIESLLKLPNFEVKYSHYSKLKEDEADLIFIYSLSYHELSHMVVTRCLVYSCPKVIVVDTANFQTVSGKNLSALLALIPIKYQSIWSEYWKTEPPIEDTLNYAFHKLALEVGFKGKLERLFDIKHIHHEGFWSWLKYLFDELGHTENWKRLFRYWIENEKIIDNIVYNLKLIKEFVC